MQRFGHPRAADAPARYPRLCRHGGNAVVCCDQCGYAWRTSTDCECDTCPECGDVLALCNHSISVHEEN